MLDPDIERFLQGLNQTGPGLRLRLAMHEGQIAIAQCQRFTRLGGGRSIQHALDSWRRTYITASEVAAEAIDQLWNKHSWPTDGARARDFEWKPPAKDFKRRE